ncbi:transglutaminase-like domain-containing protein [Kribbella jiaozuonensis]|uniref:Transglutaminase domain-containing protein n=1 Tax=Kribbella jiaozuonensis TaxID=2575441 RepID=A0A4U3LDS9_9ACTN|nr:transglutaminase-like domain-containing protein [Kribbella jiaozuonensis]TKK73638.1 transglutaminase domain-containing protein [Kribbella jiaozuonensis]
MITRDRPARHSAFSDPGRHGRLLRELSGIEEICTAATNLVFHYRAEEHLLRDDRRDEINSRWVSTILDIDQARHPGPLLDPRPPGDRVAGCCRDHSLLAVAALREQGIPARTRVGFTSYFPRPPDFRGDHVVAERWNGTRWQRFDPELEPGSRSFDVRDLPTGEGAPFETAAEVWSGYRAGRLDPARYGVAAESELSGPGFIRTYVIMEVLHRYGHEALLWDEVGTAITDSDADEIARLLLAADAGDSAAEDHLHRQLQTDAKLRPASTITQLSPYGDPPVTIDLTQRRRP